MSQEREPLLTAKQVAKRLTIGESLARQLMMQMNPVHVGGGAVNKYWRVKPAELEKWIERQTQKPEYGKLELVPMKPRKQPRGVNYPKLVDGKIPYRHVERK